MQLTASLLMIAVVKNGLWSLAKELCKTGCVITHRRDLWCRTLAVDTSQSEVCLMREYAEVPLNFSFMIAVILPL